MKNNRLHTPGSRYLAMSDNQSAGGGTKVLLDGPHVVLLVGPLGRPRLRLTLPDVTAVEGLPASVTTWTTPPVVFLYIYMYIFVMSYFE